MHISEHFYNGMQYMTYYQYRNFFPVTAITEPIVFADVTADMVARRFYLIVNRYIACEYCLNSLIYEIRNAPDKVANNIIPQQSFKRTRRPLSYLGYITIGRDKRRRNDLAHTETQEQQASSSPQINAIESRFTTVSDAANNDSIIPVAAYFHRPLSSPRAREQARELSRTDTDYYLTSPISSSVPLST
ncbi:hypothetical protein BDB01DRAFT_836644 [Pilobolus umbonatus]|nr:hypothetical protein BDB01DRAFT_836644 [Pilobolus umbonatus]